MNTPSNIILQNKSIFFKQIDIYIKSSNFLVLILFACMFVRFFVCLLLSLFVLNQSPHFEFPCSINSYVTNFGTIGEKVLKPLGSQNVTRTLLFIQTY